MKKFLAMLLVILMLMTSFALAEVQTVEIMGVGTFEVDPETWPEFDYHNYTQFPLVEDGSASISMVMPRNETYGVDPDQNWFWTWLQKASGVKLEIEQVMSSAVGDRKTIMLGTGDIPDVLYNMGITPVEIQQYGVGENLFMPLNEYINEDVMPNLSAWIAKDPTILPSITASDGNIYALPYLSMKTQPGADGPFFIDEAKLNEINLAVPTTLDELNTVLYAMKEKYGTNFYPLGGGWDAGNPIYYIINALGYLSTREVNGFTQDGTCIALRNGEAVIPAGDADFVEVLKLMKQYYDDGIISPDFFTLDATTVKGQIAAKEVGVYSGKLGAPYSFTANGFASGSEFFADWTSIIPLTSEWNDVHQYASSAGISIGGFVVSAAAADPELICRLADFYYGDAGLTAMWFGPRALTEDTLGMCEGFIYVNDGSAKDYRLDHQEDNSIAIHSVGSGSLCVGANREPLTMDFPNQGVFRMWMFGLDTSGMETWEELYANQSNGDCYARTKWLKNVTPYLTDGFPAIYFISADDTTTMTELTSVIKPYMQSEIAKFIAGKRDISEFDAYLEELNAMGFQDLLGFYKTIYANYQAALK